MGLIFFNHKIHTLTYYTNLGCNEITIFFTIIFSTWGLSFKTQILSQGLEPESRT